MNLAFLNHGYCKEKPLMNIGVVCMKGGWNEKLRRKWELASSLSLSSLQSSLR